MSNLSGIKNVKEIVSSDELIIYDKPKGGRERTIKLEKDREYIVPEYQREIKWSAENVQVLIDDLIKGSKFLGTITLSSSEPGRFEIIDGQQRLTIITLLIVCLNEQVPESKRITDLCKIRNQSFQCFEEVLEYRFDYEKIKEENLPLYNRIIQNDIQNQKDSFVTIWGSILERIKKLEDKQPLLTALCESELNVIVNEIEGTDTQRKFCVDYFIDINNKSVELDSLDIIRAYAFKEDFENTTTRWVNIQKKCNRLSDKVKYSREELYFQYFICSVNKEINYSISKLSNDYRIKEDVEVFGKKFANGAFVWNLFKNDKYYAKLLEELDEYLDFIEVVVESETGGNENFKKFFYDENGDRVDETRILNAHTVINTILRNEDMVPKMMVMKYFLEVLRPDKTKKNLYRIISSINVVATVFTLSTKRKGSEAIASKLLLKEWQKGIREYAIKIYQDVPGEIGFAKVIKENRKITIDSGLYAARRYLSMMDACRYESNNLRTNEEVFKNQNISSGEKNIEHFLINREYSYALYLDDGETIDVDYMLPRKQRKNIATITNYIIMNSEINKQLKNRPVYEKIEMLEQYIENQGIDAVIPSITSQKHYYLIKKILHDESKYPKKKIELVTSKKEKKKLLRTYYVESFYDEYMKLVNCLSNKAVCFIAEAEYQLKKVGFVLDDEQYTMAHDSIFLEVKARIDDKGNTIIMSVELCNPAYGEKNGEMIYGELIDRAIKAFTSYYGTEPEVHSSSEYCFGCPDESLIIEYAIEPDCNEIKKFLSAVSIVSTEIES